MSDRVIVTDHIERMLAAAREYAEVAGGERGHLACVAVETVDGLRDVPVDAVLEYAQSLGAHAAAELRDERLRFVWGFPTP